MFTFFEKFDNNNIMKGLEAFVLSENFQPISKSFSIHRSGLETISAELKNSILTITGYNEKQMPSFKQSFELSRNLTSEDIKIRYRRGVIFVDLMEKQDKPPNSIQVEILD